MQNTVEFQKALTEWYKRESRDLPWRNDPDPYRVWISEIMLQQTRVDTVIPYFNKFIKEIPTIKALSEIDEEKLLKLWEGLGYYNRALNLKKAASYMMENFEGRIPCDQSSLISIPGIGKYTAGAILSIAYGKQTPAVDGNVLRIMARINAVEEDISKSKVKRHLEELAQELVPVENPGDFNQALMDLGSSICVPNGAPKCERCPLVDCCESYRANLILEIPVIAAKKPRIIENKTILVIYQNGKFALRKRKNVALLSNLWELPNVEGHLTEDQCRQILKNMGLEIVRITPLKKHKHIFTHLEWHMIGYFANAAGHHGGGGLTWASKDEIERIYSIPNAFKPYLDQPET